MTLLGRISLVAFTAGFAAFASTSALVALSPAPLRLSAMRFADFAPAMPGPASAAVPKGPDGHFWASGSVNGEPVTFLVDTGATTVALTPADAERLGFRVSDLKYAQRVATAGGPSRAAAVTLSSVAVGGARLEDVGALVIEKGLDTSLLGMSYLGRLSRFEATRESLVLQP